MMAGNQGGYDDVPMHSTEPSGDALRDQALLRQHQLVLQQQQQQMHAQMAQMYRAQQAQAQAQHHVQAAVALKLQQQQSQSQLPISAPVASSGVMQAQPGMIPAQQSAPASSNAVPGASSLMGPNVFIDPTTGRPSTMISGNSGANSASAPRNYNNNNIF
jgi:hypothetical protein